jgi:hypothetical protein
MWVGICACVFVCISMYMYEFNVCVYWCRSILCTTKDLVEDLRLCQKEFPDSEIILHFFLHYLCSHSFISVIILCVCVSTCVCVCVCVCYWIWTRDSCFLGRYPATWAILPAQEFFFNVKFLSGKYLSSGVCAQHDPCLILIPRFNG